jgi:hypothetical protein
MLTRTKTLAASLFMGAAMLVTPVSPVAAQTTIGDGLVNVAIGDVTILKNVAIPVAVAAVVNLCPSVNVSNVAALASGVDQNGGSSRAFCAGTSRGQTGPVKILNN